MKQVAAQPWVPLLQDQGGVDTQNTLHIKSVSLQPEEPPSQNHVSDTTLSDCKCEFSTEPDDTERSEIPP